MNEQTTETPQMLTDEDDGLPARVEISNNHPKGRKPTDELEFELIDPPVGSHRFAHGE